MSTQAADLCNAELKLHRFTIESSGGGQQAEGIINLEQKIRENDVAFPYTQQADITLLNPDTASSIGTIALSFDHVANQHSSIRVLVLPRDPSSMGDVNEKTNKYENGVFDNAVHSAIPAIKEIPKGEFERPRVTTFTQHQEFVLEKTGYDPKYGIKIAEVRNNKERLEGITQMCNSDLLSSNPEIRSLVKVFIDSVLDGTLFKQQTLAAQDSIALLKQQSINS